MCSSDLEAVDGYGREARRVGRVLLDAQAVARLELHRGSGAAPLPVGAVFPVPTGLRERWAARTWIEAATTGKLGIPWGIGELPNGTGALDVVGGAARGTRGSSWAGGARW